MDRLLCIISAMNTGGAETFLMKIYRNLDRTKFQMDFCVNSSENFYAQEIKALGGKIYQIPLKSRHPIASFNAIRSIVQKEKYQRVIRINEHSLATFDLLAAKRGGAKILVMRSSNAGTDGKFNSILHKIFKPLTHFVPTIKMAPSTLAAEYTFGKQDVKKGNITILKNGLDIDKYMFNSETRKIYRTKLNVNDKYVVGHVGRFNQQKNHDFLLDIFLEIQKERKNAILLLIGIGELETQVRAKAKDLNILDKCIFLGRRSDVNSLLNAMDIFVFPSLYEGMPNTIIEAQTNGLPCIISDTITNEAKVTDLVHFMSLEATAKEWARNATCINLESIERSLYSKEMRKNGYDIDDVVKIFENKIWKDGE